MKNNFSYPKIATNSEVIRLNNGEELQDALESAYSNGISNATVICRSNKRANLYNQQIRIKIRYRTIRYQAIIIRTFNNFKRIFG